MKYPSAMQSFAHLLKLSLQFYLKTLIKIVIFILAVVILKALYTLLPPLPLSLNILRSLIMALLCILLISLMYYQTHLLWSDEVVTSRELFQRVFKRLGWIYSACAIIAVILFLFIRLARELLISGQHQTPLLIVLVIFFMVGLPIILIFLFFFFTIPLLTIKNYSLWQGFKQSVLLTVKNWFSVFILYVVFIFLMAFLLPHSWHALWFQKYHLLMLSDFLILCIILPIYFNLNLLIMNDLNLRRVNDLSFPQKREEL